MLDHVPLCEACRTTPASVRSTAGGVLFCSTCAVDDLDRQLDTLDPENRLGRDLALTADELLAEHGIGVHVVHLLGAGLLPACGGDAGGYEGTTVMRDVTCSSCRALRATRFESPFSLEERALVVWALTAVAQALDAGAWHAPLDELVCTYTGDGDVADRLRDLADVLGDAVSVTVTA